MNRSLTFTSAVFVAALSLAVLPATAQNRGGGHQGGGNGHQGGGGGGGRATASRPQSAPRSPQGRASSAPSGAQGRSQSPQGRSYAAPRELPRASGGGTSASGVPRGGSYQGQAVPRSGGGERYGMRNGYSAAGVRGGYHPTMARPYFSHAYARPYGWRPYYPYHFVRPYYVFSPWLSIGFGLWCGYPVPYPWVYLGDYQPTVFGDYPDDNYQVAPTPAPAQPAYGGVSFDIQPSDANLFVDGQYVGVVSSFGPANEPLTLEPGQHRIALQRDGYRPLEWDVTVEAGQVIPYKGVLDRQ